MESYSQTKKSPEKSVIVLIISVLVLAAVVGYFVSANKYGFGVSIGEQECKRIGGEIKQCFLSGPCCVKDFSDGGKQCSSGADCEAGICTIDNYTQNAVQNRYTGKCPGNFVGEKLRCGEAAIENGQIVKDLRKEKCVVY